MYVARARPYTQSVHGRGRPCTRALNTDVYRVHGRVGVPCTRPWTHYVHGRCTPVYTVRTRSERVHGHIHGTYTAVHTGRKHGRLHDRKHGRVHGHGRTMYMARARPCTQSVPGRPRPCTDCARSPALGRLQTVYTAVHGPCTWSVRVPNTAVYAAGTWQNTAGYAARTRPCTYRIHGRARYTAVYGTRPSTRPSLRPMCTAVYVPCTRPCMVRP